MGDFELAELVRLRRVPPLVPPTDRGPVSVSTVYRWASVGLHGVVLRTVRAGGGLATTERWLREFFDAVTQVLEA